MQFGLPGKVHRHPGDGKAKAPFGVVAHQVSTEKVIIIIGSFLSNGKYNIKIYFGGIRFIGQERIEVYFDMVSFREICYNGRGSSKHSGQNCLKAKQEGQNPSAEPDSSERRAL